MNNVTHKTLPCGIELAAVELPDRHAEVIEIRILAGTAHEPTDKLGLARLVQEAVDLGTQRYDGRALSDAFDEIGASHGGWVGREATAYNSVVLPEYFDRAIELHAEYLRRPTFPEDKVAVAIDLTRQEWNALQDDAHSLADKFIGAQAYGQHLGRHSLGEPETLDRITRDDLVSHWSRTHTARRMLVSAAGPIKAEQIIDTLEKQFTGFGAADEDGRSHFNIDFCAKQSHHHKDLEQQQIGLAFPGVDVTHPQYYAQVVTLGLLSGGMSSRLFTEVREKLGLVYWVSAWAEHPRGGGMIFMGASTTPDRCEQTFSVLLREVDRISEDLTQKELDRSVAGLVAKIQTQGDVTRSRCGELASDLFHFGRPRDRAQKIAAIQAVTIADIHQFLADHPRDQLSVVTLGPKVMAGSEIAESTATTST
jgi:predicted Zn-dependent peptidase